jgi:hypothetical protein
MEIEIARAGEVLNPSFLTVEQKQYKSNERCSSPPKVPRSDFCFNIDLDFIQQSEEKIKKNLSCNFVTQHLEIPGF